MTLITPPFVVRVTHPYRDRLVTMLIRHNTLESANRCFRGRIDGCVKAELQRDAGMGEGYVTLYVRDEHGTRAVHNA